MALPEVFNDPRWYGILLVAIALIVQYQRTLSWTEFRQIHKLKVRWLPVIGQFTTLFVISHKGGRDDAEFIATTDMSVRETFKRLVSGGGSPHVLCSIKKRPNPDGGGTQYSAAHVVWIGAEDQVEAFLFENDDGTTDVYAHEETSVMDPTGHLTDEQTDGDSDGVVKAALTK